MLPVSQMGKNHLIYFLFYRMKYNHYARIKKSNSRVYDVETQKKSYTYLVSKMHILTLKTQFLFTYKNRIYKADELK